MPRVASEAALAGFLLALIAGCGYVGEPMPPLLNIPQPVSDLRALEHGHKIVVEFTPPQLTTEGAILSRLGRLELRAGPGPEGAFDVSVWAAGAKAWEIPPDRESGRFEIPAGEWIGREIIIGLKAVGANGRDAGWSNLVVFPVVAPLEPPAALRAVAVREGVRLSWTAASSSFRVFRRSPGEDVPREVTRVDKAEWVDSATQYDKAYTYFVQAFRLTGNSLAESELSQAVLITPKDTFPPRAPAAPTAIAGARSIELSWEPAGELDVAGYRVYRADGASEFRRLSDTVATPSYSDSAIEGRKLYRYAVTALDRLGNESPLSDAAEITAP